MLKFAVRYTRTQANALMKRKQNVKEFSVFKNKRQIIVTIIITIIIIIITSYYKLSKER